MRNQSCLDNRPPIHFRLTLLVRQQKKIYLISNRRIVILGMRYLQSRSSNLRNVHYTLSNWFTLFEVLGDSEVSQTADPHFKISRTKKQYSVSSDTWSYSTLERKKCRALNSLQHMVSICRLELRYLISLKPKSLTES